MNLAVLYYEHRETPSRLGTDSLRNSEVLFMKNPSANNQNANSFADFSLLSILLSRPVRIIAILSVTTMATYLLGR